MRHPLFFRATFACPGRIDPSRRVRKGRPLSKKQKAPAHARAFSIFGNNSIFGGRRFGRGRCRGIRCRSRGRIGCGGGIGRRGRRSIRVRFFLLMVLCFGQDRSRGRRRCGYGNIHGNSGPRAFSERGNGKTATQNGDRQNANAHGVLQVRRKERKGAGKVSPPQVPKKRRSARPYCGLAFFDPDNIVAPKNTPL